MSRDPARLMRRLLALVGAGAAVLAVGYLGYAATTWWRYGHRRPELEGDELLEGFLPDYEVAERHEVRVGAPAAVTFAAASELDLNRSPVVRAIFALRTLPGRLRGGPPPPMFHRGILEETRALGWGVLAEAPGREIVMGAITQPWRPVVEFRALPPSQFASFREPGYAKIAWTLRADPLGPSESLFRTETRVATTDSLSRERFRRYWALLSPGILLIRREGLRLVKAEAEERARRMSRAP